MSQAFILKRPIITEKSTQKVSSESKFAFEVARSASKGQVKQAVEEAFKVTVLKVNTLIVPGKSRRTGKKRLTNSTKSWKKAIVQLKDSDKIDLFDIKKT